MRRRLLVALGAAVAIGAARPVRAGWVDVAPGEVASAPLFDARYVDPDDRPARLAASGKPLVVNFWARWCGPCKTEIPELAALQAREPALAVIGIALENDAAAVREFARAYDMTYPVLLARDNGLGLMRALGNRRAALPFTLAIDRDGRVVALRLGASGRAELDALAERLR